MSERYRPDIDGQRAIAILAVLLFHLQVQGFSGGFVGVDVFFVISGYLITRLIRDEVMATGRFQFGRFYVRRLRRLYPAMVATLLATFVAGAILFPPPLLSGLAASLMAAVLSVSNIFFWMQVGYFDVAAWLKPLLHTWSLGVEEQFYLVWPMLLVTLIGSRRRHFLPLIGLVLITLASLLANPVFGFDRSAIFYLLPFRAFELGIGGLMVWVVRIDAPAFVHEIVACIGYALIAWAVVALDSRMVFPLFNALRPCLGSACLIYAGRARFAGLPLRNPASAALGRISYSLYLVHWPIIVFARYTIAYLFTPAMKLACAAIAVAAAIVLHWSIEQRLRYEPKSGGLSRPAFAVACGIAAIVLIAPAFTAWRTGWLFRYPVAFAQQLRVAARTDYEHYVFSNFGPLVKPFADNGKLKVLVIGDSNAADFVNIVAEAGLLDSVDLRTQPVLHLCQPVLSEDPMIFEKKAPPGSHGCEENLAPVKHDPRLQAADVVVLAGMWPTWAVNLLPDTIAYLRKHSHARVAVFGTKGISVDGLTYLARNAHAPDVRRRSYPIDPTIAAENAELASEARNARAEFYDPNALLCQPKCPFLTPDGHLVIWDTFHLAKAGAQMLAQRLRADWAHQLFRPVRAGS